MSVYPPPENSSAIFNPSVYQASDVSLTIEAGDVRYLKLTGSVASGLQTLNGGVATPTIANSGNTFTVPSSSGQLALVSQIPTSTTYVDLTTNQTVGGVKTFSSAPVISSITNTGTLTLPTTTGTLLSTGAGFTIPSGSITLTNGTFVSTDNGTVSAPTFSVGGTNTGMYAGAATQLNFTVAGNSKFVMTAGSNQSLQQFRILPGSAAAPSLNFTTDTVSGLYLVGASNIGISTAGVLRADINATRLLSAVPIYTPNGSEGAPTHTFSGDSTTGMFLPIAGQVALSAGGAQRFDITSARIKCLIPLSLSQGTAGAPSMHFGTTTTGVFADGTNNVAITISGTETVRFTSTGLQSTVALKAPAGSVSSPAITFSDSTTGLYRNASNEVSVASAGQQTVIFKENTQHFMDKASGVVRCLFRSSEAAGDVVNFYQTTGSTATYFFYNASNAYGTICDERTKKNIRDVDLGKASQFIKKITPKRYELKTNDATNNGFLAQDLKAVADEIGEFGEVITEHEGGTLGVAHNELLCVITASLQNLIKRVEELEK